MKTEEKIEIEFLKAMKAIDEAQHLITSLENEDYDCCSSNLVDIKGKLKYFLNKYFDHLARRVNKSN